MSAHITAANRPPFDPLLTQIADYICSFDSPSNEALNTARYCLMDTLGCGLLALKYPACTKLLGPVVPGTVVPNGARVPGTNFVLDPITAAFNIGTLVRWLDFNDTWLAAEWGHPSDNLGAILAVADYMTRSCRRKEAEALGTHPPPHVGGYSVRDILLAMIKAHEVQGVLALENSFNRVGLDHVLLVRIASTAVATHLLGGTREQIVNAISNAWLDGGALRTYRHAPNTGSRKSWAAGDATARAVQHALMAIKGEMGYPSALSAPKWGFSDVLFRGQPIKLARQPSCYVMEHVLFKISFPAEFHAQTAVECAMQIHQEVKKLGRTPEDIKRITIRTHEACLRIIDKKGPLANPADRDHCIQYMVAVAIIFGRLTADDYEDDVAADPRIDRLRRKMVCIESKRFTRDYYDSTNRSITNALTVEFSDGKKLKEIVCEYPIGHRRRRKQGIPLLEAKFRKNLARRFPQPQQDAILAVSLDQQKLEAMAVNDYVDLFAT